MRTINVSNIWCDDEMGRNSSTPPSISSYVNDHQLCFDLPSLDREARHQFIQAVYHVM